MPIKFYAILAGFILLSAGCMEPISTVSISEPLGSLIESRNIAQRHGFGVLPPAPDIPETNSVVRINTDLPTLQPYVTVLRLPPNGLDAVQFQNLTNAIGMPVGLVGKQVNNLDFSFTWTNQAREVWNYSSENRRLTLANAGNSPSNDTVDSWPDDLAIELAVNEFMNSRGMNPLSFRNPAIQKDWREWKRKIDANETCINPSTLSAYGGIKNAKTLLDLKPPADAAGSCLSPEYPSRIPVTFDLVIDERNIMGSNGQSQIGGYLIFNAESMQVEYGWLTLGLNPARSDYPAITAEEMRQKLLNGGLGGYIDEPVDINDTFFAFYKLDSGNEYDYQYLVPALVGSGFKKTNDIQIPYNIVVPLTK